MISDPEKPTVPEIPEFEDRLRALERQKSAQAAGNLPPQRRTTLVVFLFLLLGVIALTLKMVIGYLLAVVMGGILALICQPLLRRLTSKRGPNSKSGRKPKSMMKTKHASLLLTLLVLVVIIAPIALFAIKAIQQGIAIGANVAGGGFSFKSIVHRVGSWRPVEQIFGSPQALETQARSWIQRGSAVVTGAILKVVAALPELILQVALAMISLYFLLVDGPRLRRWTANKIPMDSDVRAQLVSSFRDTAISVIMATIASAGVQAALMLVSFLILGVPGAFLAAGATFIFAWIPILGSTPVWVVGTLYLYSQDSPGKALIMLGLGAITGISDNIVRPVILKGRSNMHPLVSLVAVFGGITMFGLLGIFVGPILAAIMLTLLQIWPEVGLRFGILSPATIRATSEPGPLESREGSRDSAA